MFMSALNAPAPVIRKKRRPSNKPTSPTTNKVREWRFCSLMGIDDLHISHNASGMGANIRVLLIAILVVTAH